jgi:CspA family cold shock protein
MAHLADIDFGRTTWAASPFTAGARSDYLPKIRLNRAERREPSVRRATNVRGHPMKTGTVKFYNSQKGYGFIQPDDGGKDVFVHATALERAGMMGLVEGQKVTFDVETDRRSGKDAAANLQQA